MSDFLWPLGRQHARLPCPLPNGACSNSCPLSWWYHHDHVDCSTPGFLSFTQWSLLKLMSIESVIPSNHLILCRPLLLLSSIFPNIRVFSNKSALCIRWPKYWNFSFSITPSNEYSRLTSFRMDWFDLLAVQGTLKSLLQHHSSKASILWCSAVFIVQLSHPYTTTGKAIALTRQTFVGKVMCLLFNKLSWFEIAFPPRIKCLLISWLQSPSTVILEPRKIKSVTVSIVSPIYLPWKYNMQNAGLDEAEAGIRIAGRNIINLRYADDTTLMAES